MRIMTALKKRQYLIWGGSTVGSLLVGLVVWFVPVFHGYANQGYHEARHILLGEEEMAEAPVAASAKPSASPSGSQSVAVRLDKLEAGLAAQQVELNQERSQIEEAGQKLQASVTQLNATNVLLQKRQAEWLIALKQAAVSTGDSNLLQTASSVDSGSVGQVGTEPSDGVININTATAEQLDSLPGIGTTYAQRIVEYREQKGAFTKVDDLLNVSGIGPSTLAKFKDKVRV